MLNIFYLIMMYDKYGKQRISDGVPQRNLYKYLILYRRNLAITTYCICPQLIEFQCWTYNNCSTESCPRAPSIITGRTKRGAVIVPQVPIAPYTRTWPYRWQLDDRGELQSSMPISWVLLGFKGFQLDFCFLLTGKEMKDRCGSLGFWHAKSTANALHKYTYVYPNNPKQKPKPAKPKSYA